MTQNYSRNFGRPGRPTTVPDNIQAQEINSKRFWRENWWLVAFGYNVCCGLSTSPRLKASTQTHHNQADAHYFQSLNLYNHTMLWAACCLLFFGFSHAVEFTVNSHFNPDVHIAVGDVQAESLVNSGSFRIYIKCSKMDPFC